MSREDDEHPGYVVMTDTDRVFAWWMANTTLELAADLPGPPHLEPTGYSTTGAYTHNPPSAHVFASRKAAERAANYAHYMLAFRVGAVAVVELRWTDELWEGKDHRGEPTAIMCDECTEANDQLPAGVDAGQWRLAYTCEHRQSRRCGRCGVVRPLRCCTDDEAGKLCNHCHGLVAQETVEMLRQWEASNAPAQDDWP